jgi:hypothetical protein
VENKYLEKISHWAGYLVNGEKKLTRVGIRVNKASDKNLSLARKARNGHMADLLKTPPTHDRKKFLKSEETIWSRVNKIHSVGNKATNDFNKAKRIKSTAKGVAVIGAAAGASAAAAKALTPSKKKND